MTPALLIFAMAAAPPGPPELAAPVSALERLSDELAGAVVARGFAPPVGVFVEAPSAPLARVLTSLVSARLAARRLAPVAIEAPSAAAAEEVARARGAASVLRLALQVEGSRLTARGDALGTRVNFWSGSVPTRSGPAAALAAAVDVDREALLLAGERPAAGPLELWLSSLLLLPQVPAALAVGDVDGDRRAEMVVLSEERLLLVGPDGRIQAKAELTAPLSPRPSREPFGAVAVSGSRVLVWSARRERPEAFEEGRALRPASPPDGLRLERLGLAVDVGFNRFVPEVTWAGRAVVLPLPFQAVSLFGPLGLLCFVDGTAAVVREAVPATRVTGVGTGSTLADLDGDGTPEVVVTSPRTVGDADEVRVLGLVAFEAAQARGAALSEVAPLWGQALKGLAVAAAAGDLDGDGADEVVLGLWHPDGTGSLMLLRRVRP